MSGTNPLDFLRDRPKSEKIFELATVMSLNRSICPEESRRIEKKIEKDALDTD